MEIALQIPQSVPRTASETITTAVITISTVVAHHACGTRDSFAYLPRALPVSAIGLEATSVLT